MTPRSLFRSLRQKFFSYQPLVEVGISKSRLLTNFRCFQNTGLAIAPVLKSNAYGHGLSLVAKSVDPLGCPFFVIDSYHEALILRNEGVRTPLLIMGYTRPEHIIRNRLREVSFTFLSLSDIRTAVHSLSSPRRFHLKVDTGMNRQGVLISELNEALSLIQQCSFIILEGVASHFSDGDDLLFTRAQIKQWNTLVPRVLCLFPALRYTHISATSGVRYAQEIQANTLRLGIGLYGIGSSPASANELLPALSIRSLLTAIKKVPEGESIGYARTHYAQKKLTIATVPAGYCEGVDWRLSNRGCFTVRGVRCPLVGRVSMNSSTIDVSDVIEPQQGERVVLVSNEKNDPNSIEECARLCNTIPYELLVKISPSVRRVVDA